MNIRNLTFAAIAALLLAAAPAAAAPITITFDGLANFSNYSEDGFNGISDDWWNWPDQAMAHFDGGDATITEASLNNFAALSVDLVASGGGGSMTWEGYLDNILIVAQGMVGSGTFLFNAAFANIDALRIVYGGTTHFTVDNLVLDAAPLSEVPEPATLGLFGAGLLAVVAAHRRRASRK